MKGQGMFRRIADGFKKAIGRPVTHNYPDPVMPSPEDRAPKAGRYRIGKVREARPSAVPPCHPGTITYHDWLVRHLGYNRRLADGYLYAYRNGYNIKMPMP